MIFSKNVLIDYTNWRGKRRKRLIRPVHLEFENNEYHSDTEWTLYADDLEDGIRKGFPMSQIHEWNSLTEKETEMGLYLSAAEESPV